MQFNKNNSHVHKILSDYLENNNLRKTNTRFAILDEIYSSDSGHFDIESLFLAMQRKNYKVSRATLYNSMETLLDAGLVLKHQFGKNLSIYEKRYGRSQHDHLICLECGRVIEFCDPRIIEIENSISKINNFKINQRTLYLYGTCEDCDNKNKK